MSSTPNRAGNPAGKPRRKDTHLDLPTARQMLPLVKSIVADILTSQTALAELAPEQEKLERHRRDLAWQERARRYQVSEDIRAAETRLTAATAELTSLGVNLTDDPAGEVDFPTKINGRSAAFSWRVGEDRVGHWHYAGEAQRRPIPADWEPNAVATPTRYRNAP